MNPYFTPQEISGKFSRLSKTESKRLKERFEEAFCDQASGEYIDYKRESGYMPMTFDDFMRNYRSFPQETYVFDDQFEQALVLSHEYYHGHLKNLCLYIPAERDNGYRFG